MKIVTIWKSHLVKSGQRKANKVNQSILKSGIQKERKKETQDRFSTEIISKCVPALAQTVESNPFWEQQGG